MAPDASIATSVVGPVHYLRPGHRCWAPRAKLAHSSRQESTIGLRAHQSAAPDYVGDADIGEHSNIGASSVVVNYDGRPKQRPPVGSTCAPGLRHRSSPRSPWRRGAYTERERLVREAFRPVRWRCPGGQAAAHLRGWSRGKGR